MGPYLFDGRWNAEMPRPAGWLGHENVGTIIESRAPGWDVGTSVLAHPEDYNGFAELITSMGPECMEYSQTAVDMIVDGHVDLTEMVTSRMPWEEAPKAFQMYANPASAEGSLKLTLLL